MKRTHNLFFAKDISCPNIFSTSSLSRHPFGLLVFHSFDWYCVHTRYVWWCFFQLKWGSTRSLENRMDVSRQLRDYRFAQPKEKKPQNWNTSTHTSRRVAKWNIGKPRKQRVERQLITNYTLIENLMRLVRHSSTLQCLVGGELSGKSLKWWWKIRKEQHNKQTSQKLYIKNIKWKIVMLSFPTARPVVLLYAVYFILQLR